MRNSRSGVKVWPKWGTVSCYWMKCRNWGCKTKPKLGWWREQNLTSFKIIRWKNEPLGVRVKSNYLRVLKNSSIWLFGTQEDRFTSLLCSLIYLRPLQIILLNIHCVMEAWGPRPLVLAAWTHSIFLKYRKYVSLSWLIDTCIWFLPISFFSWEFKGYTFLCSDFNSLNLDLFICPWCSRKSCQRKNEITIRNRNNVSDEVIQKWQGPDLQYG